MDGSKLRVIESSWGFQELDGEGQQPIEVDPSTPDSDLFDLNQEGDKITFYEDAIYDLVHELREEEKRPLVLKGVYLI
jgi:hypothetical protein